MVWWVWGALGGSLRLQGGLGGSGGLWGGSLGGSEMSGGFWRLWEILSSGRCGVGLTRSTRRGRRIPKCLSPSRRAGSDPLVQRKNPATLTPQKVHILVIENGCTAVVPWSLVSSRSGADYDLVRTALSAYNRASLPVSASKGFGFASELEDASADLHFTAWGTEVDSRTGTVGAERSKRSLLMFVSLQVLAFGWTTGSFLRRLVSSFVHPFGHRRELNCVLNRVFQISGDPG